ASLGRWLLELGSGVHLAASALGTKPRYRVETGLVLVVALAGGWGRLANRPFQVRRGWGGSEHFEGEDVPVVVELEASARVAPAAAALLGRGGGLRGQRPPPRPPRPPPRVRHLLRPPPPAPLPVRAHR